MSVNALIFTEVTQHQFAYARAIGAYRIATEIRAAGYTCQVIDFFTNFNEEEMDKIITSFIGEDTLIVGFSTTFFKYIDEKLDTCQMMMTGKKTQSPGGQLITDIYPYHQDKMQNWINRMKKINPELKIVVGGSKLRYLTGPCDTFAIGPADQAIVEYMKFLEGKNPFFQFKRLNDKQIMFYGDKNSNRFNFQDSKVEWHETDHLMHGEAVPIEIARGCIFKCKFCSYPMNGKKKLDFIKNDTVLKDEFLRNYYEYGITRYTYCDDTHNDSVEKLERLHKIVTSLPFELEYAAYLRHDLIYAHKETAALLRESGLRSAIFGIETLNHESGKAIGKGLHPDKTKELLYWLREDIWKNEVAMTSGFIVGLPYDTPTTVMEWATWLLDPSCPIDALNFEPLFISGSGGGGLVWRSEFELNAEKYGYVLGELGYWKNEHFTFDSAVTFATALTSRSVRKDRARIAGFHLIMLSNLGYIPKDLVGLSRTAALAQFQERRPAYINQYKEKLLKQIGNEIQIHPI